MVVWQAKAVTGVRVNKSEDGHWCHVRTSLGLPEMHRPLKRPGPLGGLASEGRRPNSLGVGVNKSEDGR